MEHLTQIFGLANRDFDSVLQYLTNPDTVAGLIPAGLTRLRETENKRIFTHSPKMKISVPHFFTRAMPSNLLYLIQNSKTTSRRAVTQQSIIDHHHCHQFHFLSFQKFSTIIFHQKKSIINSL